MRYIASCSGGKDSVATVILAREHGEPLDDIVFAEVMFSQNISGELPEHIDFIKNKLFPTFEEWGYKTHIVHSGETYVDWWFHQVKNPRKGNEERKGKLMGWALRGGCIMNSHGKVKAIRNFAKEQQEPFEQYVGIAIDEPIRLERAEGKGQISLLAKYGFTEQMAYDLCEKYGLLSPSYSFSKRGGCWFCPSQGKDELRNLYFNHHDLWMIAEWMETLPDELAICGKDGYLKRMIRNKLQLKEYAEIFEQEREIEENQIKFEL